MKARKTGIRTLKTYLVYEPSRRVVYGVRAFKKDATREARALSVNGRNCVVVLVAGTYATPER